MNVVNKMLCDIHRRTKSAERKSDFTLLNELKPINMPDQSLLSRRSYVVPGLLMSGLLILTVYYTANDEEVMFESVNLVIPLRRLAERSVDSQLTIPITTTKAIPLGPTHTKAYMSGLGEEVFVITQAAAEVPIEKSVEEKPLPKPVVLIEKKPIQRTSPVQVKRSVDKRPVVLTAQEQSYNVYVHARWLLDQGEVGEAESQLYQALQQDAKNIAARETLVGLLLNRQRFQEAALSLQNGLVAVPQYTKFSQLLARIYVEQDKHDEALAVLESSVKYATQEASYLAFMATIYQTKTDYQAATHYFQAALRLRPKVGRWWMGLGLVYEARQLWQQAKQAFGQALDTRQLDAQLTQYIRQHIKHVSQFSAKNPT